MISIILISHGTLSKALANTAEMIMGKQEALTAIGLQAEDNPETFKSQVEKTIASIPKEHDLCIFTDILSGTPFNTVVSLARQYTFWHITGINLPILVEALSIRSFTDTDELISTLVNSMSGCVIDVNQLVEKQSESLRNERVIL